MEPSGEVIASQYHLLCVPWIRWRWRRGRAAGLPGAGQPEHHEPRQQRARICYRGCPRPECPLHVRCGPRLQMPVPCSLHLPVRRGSVLMPKRHGLQVPILCRHMLKLRIVCFVQLLLLQHCCMRQPYCLHLPEPVRLPELQCCSCDPQCTGRSNCGRYGHCMCEVTCGRQMHGVCTAY
jgi:hypothetical protein